MSARNSWPSDRLGSAPFYLSHHRSLSWAASVWECFSRGNSQSSQSNSGIHPPSAGSSEETSRATYFSTEHARHYSAFEELEKLSFLDVNYKLIKI